MLKSVQNQNLKEAILTTLFVLLTIVGFGQINFYKLAVGGGLGPTISYADVTENSQSFGGYISGDYNFTPFLTAGLEIQAGQIKGGDILTNKHNRQFKNSYKAFSVNAKIALGEFIDYNRENFLNAIKGIYIGIGLGAISNNMTYIVRYKPNTQTPNQPLGYLFPGRDKSKDLLMPVNLGMNFYFKNREDQLRYVLNFNYQGNLTFGEGLDGYDDSLTTFKNNAPDIYTLFSVGIKYNFGLIRIHKEFI